MDVLARAQRRNGSQASIIFGTDVYESFTELKAWQTGKSIEEGCHVYHDLIKKDLDAMKIEYDACFNPLEEGHRQAFIGCETRLVKSLIEAGIVEVRPETYCYYPDEGDFLAGCWISGKCPVCGRSAGSYQCEECGTLYRPMDLLEPAYRKGSAPMKVIEDWALYLTIRKKQQLLNYLSGIGIGPQLLEKLNTYFTHQGDRIRISNPGRWGVPLEIPGSRIPHVVFTYAALYFFSIYCGSIYSSMYNPTIPPFHLRSDVITVASFGMDCCIPYMLSCAGCGLESGLHRPLDFLLPNYFMHLENSKFSTSRGHAIWARDLVTRTPVPSDLIRYFLIDKNPQDGVMNFNVDEFLTFINQEMAARVQPVLSRAWEQLHKYTVTGTGEKLAAKLEDLLIQQGSFLCPSHLRLAESLQPLREWVDLKERGSFGEEDAYWWLKGFALLAYPIMPDCAISIWQLLGHNGVLAESQYFTITQFDKRTSLPVYFFPISYNEIKPSLPSTLVADTI
jgi:methionyl-tRNA synthetase